MHNGDDDDKVGYGRPPRRHRYQPGTSGNPRGRPKQLELGIPELIEKHLETIFVIREGGQERRVTSREAIVRRLQHDAAAGKPKALELLLLLYQKARVPKKQPTEHFEIHFIDPQPAREAK
jgi:hypothetical protein